MWIWSCGYYACLILKLKFVSMKHRRSMEIVMISITKVDVHGCHVDTCTDVSSVVDFIQPCSV